MEGRRYGESGRHQKEIQLSFTKAICLFCFCLFGLSSRDYVEPVMKDQHQAMNQVFHFVFYFSLSQAWRTEQCRSILPPYIYLPRWVSECLSICGFADKTKCGEIECDRQWGRVKGTETMRYSMRNIYFYASCVMAAAYVCTFSHICGVKHTIPFRIFYGLAS